jgi:hypothetical protein
MKIAINTTFGGFYLSTEAVQLLKKKGILDANQFGDGIARNDQRLIEVIEELGEKACEFAADIRIVDIPDDVRDWYVHDYEGCESVREGRVWSFGCSNA